MLSCKVHTLAAYGPREFSRPNFAEIFLQDRRTEFNLVISDLLGLARRYIFLRKCQIKLNSFIKDGRLPCHITFFYFLFISSEHSNILYLQLIWIILGEMKLFQKYVQYRTRPDAEQQKQIQEIRDQVCAFIFTYFSIIYRFAITKMNRKTRIQHKAQNIQYHFFMSLSIPHFNTSYLFHIIHKSTLINNMKMRKEK